jgi:hypothetical protein
VNIQMLNSKQERYQQNRHYQKQSLNDTHIINYEIVIDTLNAIPLILLQHGLFVGQKAGLTICGKYIIMNLNQIYNASLNLKMLFSLLFQRGLPVLH